MTTLQKLRERRMMTQKELAKASGVTQQAISAIESGKNKFPRIITLYQLARALRCTVDDLIDDDPMKKAQ